MDKLKFLEAQVGKIINHHSATPDHMVVMGQVACHKLTNELEQEY